MKIYGLMYFADSRTGLVGSQTDLETPFINNSGVIKPFQHWRHHYRATLLVQFYPANHLGSVRTD